MPHQEGARTGDRAAAIVLLVASGGIAAFLAVAGMFLIMSTDSCGATGDCDLDRFTVGWVLSMAVPILGFAATLVVTIVRLVQRKRAFWVPLAGTAAFVLGFVGAVAFAFSSLG